MQSDKSNINFTACTATYWSKELNKLKLANLIKDLRKEFNLTNVIYGFSFTHKVHQENM